MNWNAENSYQKLPELFYSHVEPTQVQSPEIVRWNETLKEELGLTLESNKEAAEILSGNKLPAGSVPIAQAYAGHQFGHFTMLGDGRAILLGEQQTPDGNRYDIQLKGAGRTPYSRGGDGRAALGPMLREYLISEAMHGLQIPTSRSLAVVKIGDPVYRETSSEGAILTRVAKSHLRVGTIQFARQYGTKEELKAVTDYAINRHYPYLAEKEDKYVSFLKEVMDKQASLIAKWQLVGFIHGVMNTDNVTISGETIDYGPCAFMDTYDRATVFSSIDRNGRYAFGNQPNIGGWNLARLAEALLLLMNEEEKVALETAKQVIGDYPALYEQYWFEGMCRKLGLFEEQEDDKDLIYRLLDLMEQHQADYTNTFRSLTLQQFSEKTRLFQSRAFKEWNEKWEERLNKQNKSDSEVQKLMRDNNPSIIPRNHLVEEVLEAAVTDNDYEKMDRFMDALKNPYAYSEEQEEFANDPPEPEIPYQTYCGT